MNHRIVLKLFYSLAITSLFSMNSVLAEHSHQHVKAMGIDVYLVVMPAEMIGGHPKDHPESLMHKENIVENINQFHVSVGVIEEKSGMRIQNLSVSARVISSNYQGAYKTMQKMQMGGEISFGNYFIISGSGAYQVEVKIQHKNKTDALIVTFDQAQV